MQNLTLTLTSEYYMSLRPSNSLFKYSYLDKRFYTKESCALARHLFLIRLLASFTEAFSCPFNEFINILTLEGEGEENNSSFSEPKIFLLMHNFLIHFLLNYMVGDSLHVSTLLILFCPLIS